MKTISIKTIVFLFFLSFFSLLSCSEEQQKEVLAPVEQQKSILVLVSNENKAVVENLPSGYVKNLVTDAGGTFRYYKTSSLETSWTSCDVQRASDKMTMNIYELKQNATFLQMFSSLNEDLNKLCLTQSQIVNFCQKNQKHLSQNGPTFFLFKEGNKFFVAKVDVFSDGLSVHVYHLENKDTWIASVYNYRVITPAI